MAKTFNFEWRDAILSPDGPASPTTRLVLLAMTKYMDDGGSNCFPSTDSLAADTALSERSVCTHIKKASEQGFVTVKERARNGYGWRRHAYVPTLPDACKRAEPLSAPEPKRTESHAEGTEPYDTNVLNLMQKRAERGSVDQSITNTGTNTHIKRAGARVSEAMGEEASMPPYDEIMADYNEVLGDKLGVLAGLNGPRRKLIDARWHEDSRNRTPGHWRKLFKYVRDENSFLTGAAKSGWTASFDWLLSEERYFRVIEGDYEDAEKFDIWADAR